MSLVTKLQAALTIKEALATARILAVTGIGDVSAITAQALLAYVTGRSRTWLLAHSEEPLRGEDAVRYSALLALAAEGQPLAQLIGEREFYGLSFAVTPDVLVPRPETEGLVEEALAWVHMQALPQPRILDVGAGSGAVAVTLAVHLPNAWVVAVDISAEALALARRNAAWHGVGRILFVRSDLLAGLSGPFDVIVANLPYISHDELLALDVGRWEPRLALDGGADGLELIRALLWQAPNCLKDGGLLLLEIGCEQGEGVAALCREVFPGAYVCVKPDLAGLDRIVRVALV